MIAIPPGSPRYGSPRDLELTRRDGNRPFVWFWSCIGAGLLLMLASAVLTRHP